MKKYAFMPKYAKIFNYELMPFYCKFVDSDKYSIHRLFNLTATNMHLHEISCPTYYVMRGNYLYRTPNRRQKFNIFFLFEYFPF